MPSYLAGSSQLNILRHRAASLTGRGNESPKQSFRKGVSEHSFGMPLNTDDPVRIAGPFDGLDGAVRSMRGDLQTFSHALDGLMVRAIHRRFNGSGNFGEAAGLLKGRGMNRVVLRLRDDVVLGVRYGCVGFLTQILNQGAAEIHVQELAAVANGEDRFFFAESVLQNGAVGVFSRGIGGLGLAAIDFPVFGGCDVGRASRQDEGIEAW